MVRQDNFDDVEPLVKRKPNIIVSSISSFDNYGGLFHPSRSVTQAA